MLRAAKGIPAWRDPMMPTLVVTTALAEGGGLFLVVGSHGTPGVTVLAIAFAAFAAFSRFLAWAHVSAAGRACAGTRGVGGARRMRK